MIMPVDVSPKDSLYYKGYIVLNEFKELDKIKFSDLFFNLREKISVNALILTLDWLYLLNALVINESVVIERVSKKS